MRQGRFHQPEVRIHIRLESTVELLLRDIFRPFFPVLVRRVADENIELAEFGNRALDRIPAELSICEIALDDDAILTFALDSFLRFRRVAPLGRKRRDRNIGSLASIQNGDGSADAGIAAGNESDLAFEFACGFVLWCL